MTSRIIIGAKVYKKDRVNQREVFCMYSSLITRSVGVNTYVANESVRVCPNSAVRVYL